MKITLHRFVCVTSILLWGGHYINLLLVQEKTPDGLPYPILFVFMAMGSVTGIYLIENHEEKWQLFVGYMLLYILLIISLGAVFFGI